MRLKLNTVVNQFNWEEELSDLIQRFAPDKWKVLRMLSVVNENLAISDQQFASFVSRHSAFARIMCHEDNQDMYESYLMVDPYGRFFQNNSNRLGRGYLYSRPILEVGAEAAFAEMTFAPELFKLRYAVIGSGERA